MRTYVAASALCAGAWCASAELVVNGGFELGAAPPAGGYINYLAGSVDLPGWTIGGESVDVHDTGHTQAHEGTRSLDLAGFNLPGAISQVIPTGVGATYTLSFWYAAHPYHPYAGPAMAEVRFGGVLIDTVALPPASDPFNMNWNYAQYQVTAGSDSSELSFTSLSPNGSIILDSISLVPSPAGFSVLLAAVVRRRRR